jgi:hypothetical protein
MIESKPIDPFTQEALEKASDVRMESVMKQIQGLNSAIENANLGQVSYEDWQTGSSYSQSKPWTITSGGTGATGAQSAIGGINQVGHIGLNPNVYTTTHPYQNLTTTGTSIGISNGASPDWNMKVEQSGQLDIRGKDADIRINGKSMNRWMEQVEQRLNILTVNPELEKEWDDLRRLGERYRKLEKKCQDKAKMWEALKKLPKVKT